VYAGITIFMHVAIVKVLLYHFVWKYLVMSELFVSSK